MSLGSSDRQSYGASSLVNPPFSTNSLASLSSPCLALPFLRAERFLPLTSLLHAFCNFRNSVLHSAGQALHRVTCSFGASGIVDRLTDAATGGANDTTDGAREATYCCTDLQRGISQS